MNRLLNSLMLVAFGILLAGVISLVSAPPRGTPIELGPAPTAAPLVVEVAGAVVQPGVYELPNGARVQDALAAAGGVLPEGDPSGLNRASPLKDGMQIAVPTYAPAPAALTPPSGTAPAAAGLININTAGLALLDSLPGIGPAIAQRIIDYRQQHGDFEKIADIVNVSGIGPATFSKIKDLITTGP